MSHRAPPHALVFLVGAMVGAALLVFGCADPAGDLTDQIEAPAVPRAAAVPPAPCPFREVVVVDETRTCRSIRHDTAPRGLWQGIKLVEDIVTDQDRLKGSYCRYVWRSDDQRPTRPPLDTFDGRIAQIDCPLVGESSTPTGYPADVWQPMQKTFRLQSGRADSLPDRAPTTVAVIDSAIHPYDSSVRDNSGHGRTVGRVIGELACPNPDRCPTEILNYLAVQEMGNSSDNPANGGYYGTRAQLASALVDALDSWEKRVRGGELRRIVVNVSLGWAQNLDENPAFVDSKRTLPQDLVWQVLRRASCLGALTVAAAGNAGDQKQRGPLFPAAWEAELAPTAEQCKRLVKEGWPYIKDLSAGELYRPLVYAAGAVDALDVPLPVTRPGSLPRLVGYGMTVVNDDPLRAPGHTLILSGTSLGSADVSGVAAAVWGMDPSLTSHALMEKIYDSAVRLSRTAEHCLGGSCSMYPVARVSLCDVGSKMSGQQLKCETMPAESGSQAEQPPPVGPPSKFDVTCIIFLGHPICFPKPARTAPSPPNSDIPWVTPQPGPPTCPTCRAHRYSATVSGYVQTDPSWGIIDADLYSGAGNVGYIPANVFFYTGLYSIPATGSAVSAGFVLFGVIGTFWGGSGVMDIIND